ncbi:site-specific integrase [Variovorax sp. J22R24]|uniref:site-specific integrase n=1 Tax=Variovorax gracilis TaxID=3053502 RepID=UPI002575B3AA|nr:site-specific integrase [Variovorax sp. J22R24]MDM0109886.1 site-specific integrase [Variovorax sp. J22R24]
MASRRRVDPSQRPGSSAPSHALVSSSAVQTSAAAVDSAQPLSPVSSKVDPRALAALRPLDVPTLAPEALSSITEASVRELLQQGQSSNTQASYAAAMRYWGAWFAARYGHALEFPVPVPAVLQFIVDHAQRMDVDDEQRSTPGSNNPARLLHDLPDAIDRLLVATRFKGKPGPLALNTLAHRLSVLSKAHQLRNLDNPCADVGVREVLRTVRVGYARRQVRPRQQAALTRELLEPLLNTCDMSPCGVRDRALILFAWASGGRRRSEVSTATMENLTDHGERGYIYLLTYSKSNQEGRVDDSTQKPVVGRAANALRSWLQLSGVQRGPVFRRILKSGQILDEPLAPRAVRKIVMARAKLAGLEGRFSAHSLRSGFVTEAGRRQMPPGEAMKMTGHRSFEVFMGYYRAGDLLNSETARMLE